jgi:hypothetical protein
LLALAPGTAQAAGGGAGTVVAGAPVRPVVVVPAAVTTIPAPVTH